MTQTPTASLPLFWSPPELDARPTEASPTDTAERFLSKKTETAAPRGHFDKRAPRPPARRMEGADKITSVSDPTQYGISQEELDLIKSDLSEYGIDISPANILHGVEANNLRRLLAEMGIDPAKRVSSTRDRLGMVRLTFVDLRRLIDQGYLVRQAYAA
jgi:hypothetical protein